MNHLPEPKPLYVETDNPAWLRLEGSALCLEQEDSVSRHFPLRRISRIHLCHRVEIETALLLACAQRGITLVFHGKDESILARLVGPPRRHRAQLRQRLIDFTERPDWRERYQDWLHFMHRRITATLCHRLKAPAVLRTHPAALQEWIDLQAERAAGAEDARQTRRIFQQVLMARAYQRLLDHGLGAEQEQWIVGPPDLGHDLGQLSAWRAEAIRLGWLRHRANRYQRQGRRPPALARQEIIARLEKISPRTERIERDLINRLHRWLVELA